MRHKTAERWLSADLGGSLPDSRKAKLQAHLVSCPRCRATRKEWERIQAGAGVSLPSENDAFWADSLARLRTALEKPNAPAADVRNPARPVPGFFPWRNWAWGAGSAGALAAAALLFVLLLPTGPLEDVYALSLGDQRVFLEEGLAADEAVLADFDESLRTSLAESLEAVPDDVAFLTADHTLSLESLSDEDVEALMSEIALETGVGEK
jgi:anti-sigma factor RsiW